MPTLNEQINTPKRHIKTRFTNLLLNVILAPKTGCSMDAFLYHEATALYLQHTRCRTKKEALALTNCKWHSQFVKTYPSSKKVFNPINPDNPVILSYIHPACGLSYLCQSLLCFTPCKSACIFVPLLLPCR